MIEGRCEQRSRERASATSVFSGHEPLTVIEIMAVTTKSMPDKTGRKALLGRKVGMTQIFDANGVVVPVTVIEVHQVVPTSSRNNMLPIRTEGDRTNQICVSNQRRNLLPARA